MPDTPHALRGLDIPRVIVMLQDFIAMADLCIPSSGADRTGLDASLLYSWRLLVGHGFDENVATYALLMQLARASGVDVEDADRAFKTAIAEQTVDALSRVAR